LGGILKSAPISRLVSSIALSFMANPAGKCVWCGGGGLTKGHVWADWLRRLMAFQEDHQHLEIAFGEPNTQTQTVRLGSALGRKPRNTCRECNEKWMSQIENGVIPVATSLILGKSLLLDISGRWSLAAFLCLIAIRVSLLARRSSSLVSAEERNWLMQRREPPPHWKIWIARIADKPFDEHWTLFSEITRAPPDKIGPHRPDVYCITIVLGQLCAHVLGSVSDWGFVDYEGVVLTDIWPPSQLYVDSRLIPTITHDAARALHNALRHPVVKKTQ
jgi:hypothetical protein